MLPKLLQTVVVLGFVVSNLTADPADPDCLASSYICRSHLCKSDSRVCADGGCQIKGSLICNMTIKSVLDQFPSLCRCVEGAELCGSVPDLATQCLPKPAAQVKRRTMADWGRSDLKDRAHDLSGSCSDQVRVCVSDSVCNGHLGPVLQACAADHCVPDRCGRATQNFYAQMPPGVAEMLAMCGCNASDQSCVQMQRMLHSGACGQETRFCLETVTQCEADAGCRDLLVNFQSKCWRDEDRQCRDSDLGPGCVTELDPELIVGGDRECRESYVATLGTPLHHPCSCERLRGDDLLSCNMIRDIFHNRSYFVNPVKKIISTEPPAPDESQEQTFYLLYTCAVVLPVVFLLVILAVITKMCKLRKKKRFHPPQKSNCVLVL